MWKDNFTTNVDARLVTIPYTLDFKFAHSSRSDLIFCPIGGALGGTCTSSRMSLTAQYSFVTGVFDVTARTNATQMNLGFSTVGVIDDRDLDSRRNFAVFVRVFPIPLPIDAWISVYTPRSLPMPVDDLSLVDSEQSISLTVELTFPRIQRKLVYDPDVSIILLFNPEENSTFDDLDQQAATSGAVIAVAVVVPIVIVVAIILFAKFVFPYALSLASSSVFLAARLASI